MDQWIWTSALVIYLSRPRNSARKDTAHGYPDTLAT